MTDKEKILAEIERLKAEAFNKINHDAKRDMVTDVANSQRIAIYEQLLDFINSLPAEQPSEELDIDEELQRFFKSKHLFVDADDLLTVRHCGGSPADKIYYFENVARHFAKWQKEQMINKACEWLRRCVDVDDEVKMLDGEPEAKQFIRKNLHRIEVANQIVEDFKKAMEDEQ